MIKAPAGPAQVRMPLRLALHCSVACGLEDTPEIRLPVWGVLGYTWKPDQWFALDCRQNTAWRRSRIYHVKSPYKISAATYRHAPANV